jgi:hypothetical protein
MDTVVPVTSTGCFSLSIAADIAEDGVVCRLTRLAAPFVSKN